MPRNRSYHDRFISWLGGRRPMKAERPKKKKKPTTAPIGQKAIDKARSRSRTQAEQLRQLAADEAEDRRRGVL